MAWSGLQGQIRRWERTSRRRRPPLRLVDPITPAARRQFRRQEQQNKVARRRVGTQQRRRQVRHQAAQQYANSTLAERRRLLRWASQNPNKAAARTIRGMHHSRQRAVRSGKPATPNRNLDVLKGKRTARDPLRTKPQFGGVPRPAAGSVRQPELGGVGGRRTPAPAFSRGAGQRITAAAERKGKPLRTRGHYIYTRGEAAWKKGHGRRIWKAGHAVRGARESSLREHLQAQKRRRDIAGRQKTAFEGLLALTPLPFGKTAIVTKGLKAGAKAARGVRGGRRGAGAVRAVRNAPRATREAARRAPAAAKRGVRAAPRVVARATTPRRAPLESRVIQGARARREAGAAERAAIRATRRGSKAAKKAVERSRGGVSRRGAKGIHAGRLAAVAEGETDNLPRKVLIETPRAYVEKPSTVSKDVQFAKEVLAGLPAVPYELVKNPKGFAKSTLDYYKEFYGGTPAEYRQRIKQRGGLQVGLDVGLPGGAVAGKAAGRAAKVGTLGRRARTLAHEPRPQRRISPGTAYRQRSESRKSAPNIVRLVTQRRRDEARRRKLERQNARAGTEQRAHVSSRGQVAPGTRRFVQPRRHDQLPKETPSHARVAKDRNGEVRSVTITRKNANRPDHMNFDRRLARRGWTRVRHGNGDYEYFPRREVVGRSRTRERMAQRRDPAMVKGRAVAGVRHAQAEVDEDFDRIMRTLTPEQQDAVFYRQAGTTGRTPQTAKAALRIRREQIRERRTDKESGEEMPLDPNEIDELDKIAHLERNADKIYTPEFDAKMAELQGVIRREERENPALEPQQRVIARYGMQARVTGVGGRREVPIERFDQRASEKAWARRQRRQERQAGVAARRRGRRRERRGEAVRAERPRELPPVEPVPQEYIEGIIRGQERAEAVRRGEISPEEALPGRRLDEGEVTLKRGGESRPTGPLPTRLAEPQLVQRGLDEEGRPNLQTAQEKRLERAAPYARRVREAAEKYDLPTPAFVPSEPFFDAGFINRTAGTGATARQGPKQRSYALHDKGIQRTDAEVVRKGIQRNVGMRFNWKLVSDIAERHADPRYMNLSYQDLRYAIQRGNIDPSQVAVHFPRLLREAAEEIPDRIREDAGRLLEVGDFEGSSRLLHDAIKRSTITFKSLAELDELTQTTAGRPRYQQMKGMLIPRSVANELEAATRGSGGVGRGFERLKSMQSRAVLGANVAWLSADTLTNNFLAFLQHGITPWEVFTAKRLMGQMPRDVRQIIAENADISNLRSSTYIPHMGASVGGKLVDGYRRYRNTPWADHRGPINQTIGLLLSRRYIQTLNTKFLELEKKLANDPVREALLVRLAHNEAVRRLDGSLALTNRLMERTIHTLAGKDVRAQMEAILRDPEMIEDFARSVNESFGDFATLTATERTTIGRYLFFYPYLRFSLRWTFYTLPMNHPLRLSIIANLSHLAINEQMELLDAGPEDLHLLAGRFFYRDDKGQIREHNVRSLNPFSNVVTEATGSERLLSALIPAATIGLGQLDKEDKFRDRPWQVRGEPTKFGGKPEMGSAVTNLYTRARVLGAEILNLSPLTRDLQRLLLPGEQGNDSLFFDPRPIKRKPGERQRYEARKKRKQTREPVLDRLLQNQLRFILSKPSDIEGQLERAGKARGEKKGKGGAQKNEWSRSSSSGGSTEWRRSGSGSSSSGAEWRR